MGLAEASPVLNAVFITVVIFSVYTVKGQISTPCTSSIITSFTPCFNFITGSSRNGTSPIEDCCDSLKSLVSGSMDCACLIITGNVPFSLPFTRNIAISLPRMCNTRVPIQCKVSGTPLSAPGPVLFQPTSAPTASAPGPKPRVSKASAMAESKKKMKMAPEPSPEVRLAPSGHPGIRPVLNPNSDSNRSYALSPPFLLIIILRIMVFCLN